MKGAPSPLVHCLLSLAAQIVIRYKASAKAMLRIRCGLRTKDKGQRTTDHLGLHPGAGGSEL